MSIKYALLSVIAEQPRPAGEIKTAFEDLTDHTWPLNIGQVYQSVKRFVRDGLVSTDAPAPPPSSEADQPATPSAGGGRAAEVYAITEAGVAELRDWWHTPILKPIDDRDDLVIKLAVACRAGRTAGTPPALYIVDEQRAAALAQLRTITAAKTSIPEGNSASWLLMEHHVFAIEAQLRWLDLIESTLTSEQKERK